jgi:putative nucleotidyltransferase with HDIG domain
MDAIDAIIEKVNFLRPFPQQVPQLLELLDRDDVDTDQVVDLIAYDPALTANVMRLSNSVIFGSAQPASDLQEAVFCLGFHEVYQLVVVLSSAGTLMPAQKGYGLETADLWRHSVATATAAKVLAGERDLNASVAFTAGLLHDLGKVVLAHGLEEAYAKLHSAVENAHLPMIEAEKKLLGVNHAEVGGRILARWKFPAALVAPVWNHHDPAHAKPYETMAACVYLANLIAYFMGYGYGHFAFAMRGRSEALEILGMDAAELPRIMIRTFEAMERSKPLMNFPA